MPRQSPRARASEGRRRASSMGGDVVREEFDQALTRKRFCELVGIHLSTLRRWEQAGVVKPTLRRILNIPTWIFAPDDVDFGRQLIKLLRDRPGELALGEAAAAVRARPG